MSDDQQFLDHMRHSLAHILAQAVMDTYPNVKLGVGPTIENGFYYDFGLDETISEADLKKIEKKMKRIVSQSQPFSGEMFSTPDAKKRLAEMEQPFKIELVESFEEEGTTEVSFYSNLLNDQVKFVDLCRGGHLEHTGQVGAFKLVKVAGAYWRGDENNPMLQRIYGVAFKTKEELDAYLKMMEEAKKRDHRKLGQQLDLFTFSELVGPGLPLFTPRGTIMREELTDFVWRLMKPYGYTRVNIPHMAKSDLYKTSGHWDKFADDIFHISSKKTDTAFVMKPMNCPHHTQIYDSRPRSYKELPLRYSEVTTVYRDENTGQLQGLTRVRSITQDDAHVFCRMDQVKEEALAIYDIVTSFYEAFGMTLNLRLSMHDPEKPEKYLGGAELWDSAVGTLREMLDDLGKEYEEAPGEAAFYGPKIDFIARDAIGRDWQLATIQLDFNLPERFNLTYVDSNGEKQRPVMIHRAILGSVERFMGVLIEHFAGAFPFWLSPEQIRLLPVSDKFNAYAEKVRGELEAAGYRATLDDSSNSLGKKIREAELWKIPSMLIIGENEMNDGTVTERNYGQREQNTLSVADFIAKYNEAKPG